MISKRNSARIFLIAALVVVLLIALFTQRRTARIEATVDELEQGESKTPTSSAPAESPTSSTIPGVPPPTDPMVVGQMKIFEEVLASRNDNDPRIDKDLKVLNAEAKAQLRARYQTLPAEKRNQRGFVVFLLGRNLTEPADFEFLKSVVQESPCLSLEDCKKAPPTTLNQGEEEHHPMGAVLAYPQLVALHSTERFLKSPPSSAESLKSYAADVVKTAESSPVGEVSQKARQISR